MNRRRHTLADYNKQESFKSSARFFIVYEAEVKELKYFGTFNNLFLDPKKASILHVLEKDTKVVGSQPKKLIERAKAFIQTPPQYLPVTPNEFDRFRFVLDVDKHPKDQFTDLKKYCKSLEDADLFISNINFEVWLYFHLDEQSNLKSNTSETIKTELGKKHTECKMKNYPNCYLTTDRINIAIERAEKADLVKDNYFPVEKSTKVYLLVKELLEYSILNNPVDEAETL